MTFQCAKFRSISKVLMAFLLFVQQSPSPSTIASASSVPASPTASIEEPSFEPKVNDVRQAMMMGRIEASLMGESALIDRETGRVYWEGASEHTLYESIMPKVDSFIGVVEHFQATALTVLLCLVVLGVLRNRWNNIAAGVGGDIENTLVHTSSFLRRPDLMIQGVLLWIYVRFPTVERPSLIVAIIALYLLESYSCTTRRYLANSISSQTELETYLEQLKNEQPTVAWTVKTFHYEPRRILLFIPSLYSTLRRRYHQWRISSTNIDHHLDDEAAIEDHIKRTADVVSSTLHRTASKSCPSRFPWTKKVISYKRTQTYAYGSCQDSTQAGLWKRASSTASTQAPFTKLVLTKLLVLADRKSREEYFKQQSEFVTKHGRNDEFVEFSTDIQVPGYKRRLLALRPVEGVTSSSKLFRLHLFWIFTLCGMTLPYRLWFAHHCDSLRVTIVKETSATPGKYGSSNSQNTGSASNAIKEFARSWFTSKPDTPSADQSQTRDQRFRSFMQGLLLYPTEPTVADDPVEVVEAAEVESAEPNPGDGKGEEEEE